MIWWNCLLHCSIFLLHCLFFFAVFIVSYVHVLQCYNHSLLSYLNCSVCLFLQWKTESTVISQSSGTCSSGEQKHIISSSVRDPVENESLVSVFSTLLESMGQYLRLRQTWVYEMMSLLEPWSTSQHLTRIHVFLQFYIQITYLHLCRVDGDTIKVQFSIQLWRSGCHWKYSKGYSMICVYVKAYLSKSIISESKCAVLRLVFQDPHAGPEGCDKQCPLWKLP